MTETPRPPASRLAELLEARQFAITAEITPAGLLRSRRSPGKALPLKGLADAVNVTDGASARAHLSAPIAAALLAREGIEPILQLTCRDRNRIALQAELMGAAASGIHNILLLTGDDPKAGDQPETKAVFDIDSTMLTRTAREHARQARAALRAARSAAPARFFLGAADVPIDPPPDWKPDKLAAKIAAGAQFAQTQFCMDAGIVRRYVARLAEHEATRGFPLLIGIAPLRAAKSARWMQREPLRHDHSRRLHRAAGAGRGSRRPKASASALELIEELATIPGVAGVHIMAPANEAAVPGVIAEARKRLKRA